MILPSQGNVLGIIPLNSVTRLCFVVVLVTPSLSQCSAESIPRFLIRWSMLMKNVSSFIEHGAVCHWSRLVPQRYRFLLLACGIFLLFSFLPVRGMRRA